MTLDRFMTLNYLNIMEVSKNISGGSEWHKDAAHMIIQEVYEMNEKEKWKPIFQNMLNSGNMMSFINRMMNTQYKSTTSNVWRNLRRPLEFDEKGTEKIIDYLYSEAEDREEIEKKIKIVKIYLNLFNPIDVIIYKDYFLNNKNIKEILEDWNISRKYFYNTISIINKGIKLYLELRNESRVDLIIRGCKIVRALKKKPTRLTKMELIVIYNLISTDKVDNYDNDLQFKGVKDFFNKQSFAIKYKNI